MTTLESNIENIQKNNIKLNILQSQVWNKYSTKTQSLSSSSNVVKTNILISILWKTYSEIKEIINKTNEILDNINNGNYGTLQARLDNVDKSYINLLKYLNNNISTYPELENIYKTVAESHNIIKNNLVAIINLTKQNIPTPPSTPSPLSSSSSSPTLFEQITQRVQLKPTTQLAKSTDDLSSASPTGQAMVKGFSQLTPQQLRKIQSMQQLYNNNNNNNGDNDEWNQAGGKYHKKYLKYKSKYLSHKR